LRLSVRICATILFRPTWEKLSPTAYYQKNTRTGDVHGTATNDLNR